MDCVFEVIQVYLDIVEKYGLVCDYMVMVWQWYCLFLILLIFGIINVVQLEYLFKGKDLMLNDDVLVDIEVVYKQYLMLY